MSVQNSTTAIHSSSTGHSCSDRGWLEIHFEAARPEYEAMLQSVGIESGWRVLDAGCGGGSFLSLIAEAVGPTGHISALDLAPENINRVKERLIKGNFASNIETAIGSLTELHYPDNNFDAIWCANVSQYLTDGELSTALTEFRRVVRPGGMVAVKESDLTSYRFYPSDPTLYWRALEAARQAHTAIAGALRATDLSAWLKQSGLSDVWQKTTVSEWCAPLRPVEREFIEPFFGYIANSAEQVGISEMDIEAWHNLKDLSAPDHILNRPDFYFREGNIVAVGRIPSD